MEKKTLIPWSWKLWSCGTLRAYWNTDTISLNKYNIGLYRDNGLFILRKINKKQTDRVRKKITSIFRSINFKIEIVTSLTEVDVTFNLENNTYRRYKKPNDKLIHIDVSSNYSPQIKKQLTKIISDRLSRNSSNADIFNNTKLKYEEALKKCGHTTKLTYTTPNHEKSNIRRKRQRKIIWFNPPFILDVSTNVEKILLNLIEKHFTRSSKLHKIFNKNTVRVSYSCTQNMSQIIKGHNKKIVQKETQETLECNCRVKTDCPLNCDCRKESVIYNVQQQPVTRIKFVLDWLSSKNRGFMTMSNLLKTSFMPTVVPSEVIYGKWKKKKCNTSPYMGNLTNYESIFQYNKKVLFMPLQESSDHYLSISGWTIRQSELVTKCRHENKFLLKNFNSNDWSFEPYDNLRKYNINNIPNGFILLAFSAWVIRQEQNKDIFKLI